jgi:hypothetical protein
MTAAMAPETPTASANSQMYNPNPTAQISALALPSTLGARGATLSILPQALGSALRTYFGPRIRRAGDAFVHLAR